jgi:serine/threonine-protein kinase
VVATITKHLAEPVEPPSRRCPDLAISTALERVCLRALQKSPGDRYPDAASMAAAVRDAVAAHTSQPVSVVGADDDAVGSPRTRAPMLAAALVVTGAILLASIAWLALE